MRWRAELHGNEQDLTMLASLFRHGDITIERSFLGRYELTSIAFDDLHTAPQVQSRAAVLLDRLNGMARSVRSNYEPVSLSGRFSEGSAGVVVAEVHLTARSWLIAPADGALAGEVAERDANVAEALALLGRGELDWVRLYKVWEIVRDDLGGQAKVRRAVPWVTGVMVSTFTESANRPEISGGAARHARLGGAASGRVMNLSEGSEFIGRLIRDWMDYKASALR